MTAEEYIEKNKLDNAINLGLRKSLLIKMLNDYGSQCKEQGIVEGFEAAREGLYSHLVVGFKYPTVNDYLQKDKI